MRKEIKFTENWNEVNEQQDDLLLRNTFLNAHLPSSGNYASKPETKTLIKWVDTEKIKSIKLADYIPEVHAYKEIQCKASNPLKPSIKSTEMQQQNIKNNVINNPMSMEIFNPIDEFNSALASRNISIGKSKSDSNNPPQKSPQFQQILISQKKESKKQQRPSSVNPKRKQSPSVKVRKGKSFETRSANKMDEKKKFILRPINHPKKANDATQEKLIRNYGDMPNINNVGGIIMNINSNIKPSFEGNFIFPQFIQINNYQAPYPVLGKNLNMSMQTENREKAKSFLVNERKDIRVRKPSPSIEQRKLRAEVVYSSEKKPRKFIPDTNKLTTVSKVYGQKKLRPHTMEATRKNNI